LQAKRQSRARGLIIQIIHIRFQTKEKDDSDIHFKRRIESNEEDIFDAVYYSRKAGKSTDAIHLG
jgi:hypothetical protein